MTNYLNLTSIIVNNIKNDIITNFLTNIPLILILNPESFDPPFTNGFEEFLSLSPSFTTTNLSNNYVVLLINIVFAGLDIIYSILRLCLSAIFIGLLFSIIVFCSIWFIVTITRRWKLITMILRNNEFEGIW